MSKSYDKTPTTSGTPAPKGDLGGGEKTWTPAEGEQGISNRPDDDPAAVPPGDEADDAAAFGAAEDDEDDEVEDERP